MTKIETARAEYKEWGQAIGITSLDKINEIIDAGKAIELINLCEARQERQYAQAADHIYWQRSRCRIVMMSGPSSSGKTSSSLRIAQQARVLGLRPKVLELDNYFVSREETPLDENVPQQIAAQIKQAYRTVHGDEPECAVIKPSDGARLV